jgi:hypothetical protein
MPELDPQEMLARLLRWWWILALLTVLGGLAGRLASSLRAPIYEATAVYDVSVDGQTLVAEGQVTADKLPLDFPTQNLYLSPADAVFFSTAVEGQLVAQARAQGIPLPANTFDQGNFYLDRNGSNWLISARSTDPSTAARLVNLWLNAADAALKTAQEHTARSLSIQLAVASVRKCFLNASFAQGNLCAGTSFANSADLETFLSTQQQLLTSEREAGQGIDPALDFTLVARARPPTDPDLYSVSLMTLAGALIGLLIAVLIVQFAPARGKKE